MQEGSATEGYYCIIRAFSSTLSRELQATWGTWLSSIQANNKAIARHKAKPKAIKLTSEIKALINGYIEEAWSPEQVVGRLKNNDVIHLHHETIYQYIILDKKKGGQFYTLINMQSESCLGQEKSTITCNA